MLYSSVFSIRTRVLGWVMKCRNVELKVPRIGKNERPKMRENTGIRSRAKTMSVVARRDLVPYILVHRPLGQRFLKPLQGLLGGDRLQDNLGRVTHRRWP